MKIGDRRLAQIYGRLEAQRRADPTYVLKAGDPALLELVAALGAGPRTTYEKVLSKLRHPGQSTDSLVALAKKGLSRTEKADLARILDQGTVPLEARVRELFGRILDRTSTDKRGAPSSGSGDPLDVFESVTYESGKLKGRIGAPVDGVVVSGIDATTAPGGRLHLDDFQPVGKSRNGVFEVDLPDVRPGDLLRLQASDGAGRVGRVVELRVPGEDTRPPVVALFRIGLFPDGDGQLAVSNINEGRPVGEPGAELQLVNQRTGEKTVVALNAEGSFPKELRVKGEPGDVFAVAASDGVNNRDFALVSGSVKVAGGTKDATDFDLPDPVLNSSDLGPDGKPRFDKARFEGPLVRDGYSRDDVVQGNIGDCYFPAAMAALAQARPDAIARMIDVDESVPGRRLFHVTFKEKDWQSGKWKDVVVDVDGDLWTRSSGGPLYGAGSRSDREPRSMEMWFPIVEKAYAKWKGGYGDIGEGGKPGNVFEACLGQDSTSIPLAYNLDGAWDVLQRAMAAKLPVAACTQPEYQAAMYQGTGVYADHTYSVLGVREEKGQRYVTVRNPWGESEPAGNGENDGVFELTLEEFGRLFQSIDTIDDT